MEVAFQLGHHFALDDYSSDEDPGDDAAATDCDIKDKDGSDSDASRQQSAAGLQVVFVSLLKAEMANVANSRPDKVDAYIRK